MAKGTINVACECGFKTKLKVITPSRWRKSTGVVTCCACGSKIHCTVEARGKTEVTIHRKYLVVTAALAGLLADQAAEQSQVVSEPDGDPTREAVLP